MLEQLKQAIASRRDEMAELTAALVAIDTENPPGRNYERCIRFLGERVDALGMEARIEPVPGGDADPAHPRFWLKAVVGESSPTVYFHGHYDVVPAQSRDQFTPSVTEDTIFGRRSTDMKGGLVSMIYAMGALREVGAPLAGRVVLQVVPDEENGGALGAHALGENNLLVGDNAVAMIAAEPTGVVVWHACRGAITCHITVRGRQSHVGFAYRGVNAFERRTSYPIEPDDARRSILMMGGEVSGGGTFNVVRESFTFSVDRRINPEEDFDTEKRRLLHAIQSTTADVEVDLFQETRPAGVPESDPTAKALREAITEVTGELPRFELCPGILETRLYAARGVPAFAYGPGLLTLAHGAREFVKRKELEDVACVFALTATSMLAP